MTTECHRQAAEWVLRLKEPNLSEDVVLEWLRWCEADSRNRSAFEEMTTVWERAGDLDASDVEARASPCRRWAVWSVVAVAASIVGISMTALLWTSATPSVLGTGPTARLTTDLGRLRRARLPDGTEIDLGGRSTLSVRYTRERRLVIAEAGEVFFQVHKNPSRPFVVRAGPVTITAIGTAFAVEREGDSVVVNVTDGLVEVRTQDTVGDMHNIRPRIARVGRGQRVRFDHGELTPSLEPSSAESATSWREGRLEFKAEPLRLAVARMNRYSPQQIRIADRSLEDLRVTGTAYSDRIDAWLAGLEAVLPVRVRRDDAREVTLVRASSATE